MDKGLVVWARRVKRQHPKSVPLWVFTDETRLPDPLAMIKTLPSGLSGVLLRHDTHSNRSGLAKNIARLCRRRGVALMIAGDARLAQTLKVGLHLRGGEGGRPHGWWGGGLSASVHNVAQLRRARRHGATVAFISPVFVTASHPGAASLGVLGWRGLARQAGKVKPCALGGINGKTVRRLGPLCAGIGAIEAFL